MGNKHIEIDCLERVVRCSKSLRGESKKIIQLLSGEDVPRKLDERPDFIKRYKDESGCTIIGIEHFQVDYSSITKKDGKIAGTTTKFNKDNHAIFDKYKPYVDSDNKEMMYEAICDIHNNISQHYLNASRTSYRNFLKYFRTVLETHISKIDSYLENINHFAQPEESQKLAFLIEVHSDFFEMFYNNGGKLVKKNTKGIMPLFRDVIELLKKVDSDKVDYIILCCGGPLYNDIVKVYALNTANIEKSVYKSGNRIYDYYGEDMLLHEDVSLSSNDSIEVDVIEDENGYKATYTYNGLRLTNEAVVEFGFFALNQAYLAKCNKKDFVATRFVQKWLYVIKDFLIGWQRLDNKDWWKIKPVLNGATEETLDALTQRFEEKWFPDNGEK